MKRFTSQRCLKSDKILSIEVLSEVFNLSIDAYLQCTLHPWGVPVKIQIWFLLFMSVNVSKYFNCCFIIYGKMLISVPLHWGYLTAKSLWLSRVSWRWWCFDFNQIKTPFLAKRANSIAVFAVKLSFNSSANPLKPKDIKRKIK